MAKMRLSVADDSRSDGLSYLLSTVKSGLRKRRHDTLPLGESGYQARRGPLPGRYRVRPSRREGYRSAQLQNARVGLTCICEKCVPAPTVACSFTTRGRQVPQVIERVFDLGNLNTHLAPFTITTAQQFQFLKIG